MALIVRDPPVPPSPVALYGSDSIGFLPAGTGALTTRTVRDALRAMVRSGDYDTAAHFNTAEAALTETIGVNALDIGINGASSVINFPARTSGRGPCTLASFDNGPFNGTPDPSIFFGYNYTGVGGASVGGEPTAGWFVEGNYNDGSGANKMEMYCQWNALPGQGTSTYRPFFSTANRSTGSYQNQIGGALTQFVGLDMTSSVMDVYQTGTNGILMYKKLAISALAPNTSAGLSLADTTPQTVTLTPSFGPSGLPGLATAGGYGLSFGTAGLEHLRVVYLASTVNYWNLVGSATTGDCYFGPNGTDSNINTAWLAKGTGIHKFYTGVGYTSDLPSSGVIQVEILHTASASRFLTLTGSNGGNPTISTSAGSVAITPAMVGAASLTAHGGTAIPAGGTAGAGLLVSSTANYGVFFGSGAPTLSAAKGSLYLRSDGTGTTDRAYINTNGSTTWTALTTVA